MIRCLVVIAAVVGVAVARPESVRDFHLDVPHGLAQHRTPHQVVPHHAAPHHRVAHHGLPHRTVTSHGVAPHAAPHHGVPHSGAVHAAPYHPAPYHDDHHGPAHYTFDYAVHDDYSGNHFGHTESRDGYDTKGSYFVHLPDGRIQTVEYYVDQHGYHPTVTYEGTAQHPTHHGSPYHAPVHQPGPYHAPVHHAPVHHAHPSAHH